MIYVIALVICLIIIGIIKIEGEYIFDYGYMGAVLIFISFVFGFILLSAGLNKLEVPYKIVEEMVDNPNQTDEINIEIKQRQVRRWN